MNNTLGTDENIIRINSFLKCVCSIYFTFLDAVESVESSKVCHHHIFNDGRPATPENIWSVWLDYWHIGRYPLHIHFYFHIKRTESNLAIIAFIGFFSRSLYVCVAVVIRATDLGHLKRVVWILSLKFILMSEETYRERQPPQFLLVIY